jgi:hypothetical protein
MEGRSGLQAAKQRSSLAVERSSVQGRTQKHVKVRPRKAVLDFQIAGRMLGGIERSSIHG